MFWVFRVKNHDFMQKNHIFSNFRGGGACRVHPPSPPRSTLGLVEVNIICTCSSLGDMNQYICINILTHRQHINKTKKPSYSNQLLSSPVHECMLFNVLTSYFLIR